VGSSEERDVECVISINAFFGSALLFWLTQRTSRSEEWYWFSLIELGQSSKFAVHKYGTGSGSDRVNLRTHIGRNLQLDYWLTITRSLPLPVPYLCGAC